MNRTPPLLMGLALVLAASVAIAAPPRSKNTAPARDAEGAARPAPSRSAPGSDSDAPGIGDAKTIVEVASCSLDYGRDVGFREGAEDELPVGPDYLTAGPDRSLAFYDVVDRKVIYVDKDCTVSKMDERNVDSLALTRRGNLLVMDGNASIMRIYSPAGELVTEREVERTTRSGDRLTLDQGVVYAVDVEGNRTEVGQMTGGQFSPPTATPTAERQTEVLATGNRVVVAGQEFMEAGAKRVSARIIGGRPRWFEMEALEVEGRRFAVKRWARSGQARHPLPVEGRRYIPSFDTAVAPDNAFVFMNPTKDALKLVWLEAR